MSYKTQSVSYTLIKPSGAQLEFSSLAGSFELFVKKEYEKIKKTTPELESCYSNFLKHHHRPVSLSNYSCFFIQVLGWIILTEEKYREELRNSEVCGQETSKKAVLANFTWQEPFIEQYEKSQVCITLLPRIFPDPNIFANRLL